MFLATNDQSDPHVLCDWDNWRWEWSPWPMLRPRMILGKLRRWNSYCCVVLTWLWPEVIEDHEWFWMFSVLSQKWNDAIDQCLNEWSQRRSWNQGNQCYWRFHELPMNQVRFYQTNPQYLTTDWCTDTLWMKLEEVTFKMSTGSIDTSIEEFILRNSGTPDSGIGSQENHTHIDNTEECWQWMLTVSQYQMMMLECP